MINTKSGECNWTPLHEAARQRDTRALSLLLSTPGVDVNVEDDNGKTAFDWAVRDRHSRAPLLLANHEGFKPTKKHFINMIQYNANGDVCRALSRANGGWPSWLTNDRVQSLFRAGSDLRNQSDSFSPL